MNKLFENWREYLHETPMENQNDFDYMIEAIYHFVTLPVIQGPLAPDPEDIINTFGTREDLKENFKRLPTDIKIKIFHQFLNSIEDIFDDINSGADNETTI